MQRGAGNRQPLPDAVVDAVRVLFPGDGAYMGYRAQ